MQMPFLVRYPKKVAAGARSDAIVENVDYGPTMLSFAGVKTPEYMQGRSFHDICVSGTEAKGWKKEAYYRYWMHMAHHDNPGHVGIRTKDYKLMLYYGCNYKGENRTPPGWELYDLKNDPTEVVNQYDNPKYAKVVKDLKGRLAKLRKRVGDTGEDFPKVEAIIDEFWEYDEAAKKKAIQISHDYLAKKK
jgi:N-acetylglucosamine-6-sulfatase